MIPSLLLLLTGVAVARDGAAYIFVPPAFQSGGADTQAAADTLPDLVAEELKKYGELRPITIEKVDAISGMPADVYASSCPPGQFVGCAFVLGQTANADLAVAGAVTSSRTGTRVEVHIVDISQSEDAISFEVDLGSGDEQVFAEGVARVLLAVVAGQAGQATDIREDGGESLAPSRDLNEANRQLEALSKEIGGVNTLEVREGGRIERPRMTAQDLTEQMAREGVKPWERLDMSAAEYLRYRNSGLNILEWRARAAGRQRRILLRPYLGFGQGPVDVDYVGQYARSSLDLSVVETWAWQAVDSSSGLQYGLQVGYGLLPELEVGLTLGGAAGRYSATIDAMTEGQTRAPEDPTDFPNSVWYVGPTVLGAPFPTLPVRPQIGASFLYMRSGAVDDHVAMTDELPVFEPATILAVQALPGAEARLGARVDFFMQVPLTFAIGGHLTEEASTGGGILTRIPAGEGPSAVGAGVQAGLQIRLGPGPKAASGIDAYDEY